MRHVVHIAASLVALAACAFATLTPDSVEITGSFPKANQFGVIYNGEPNQLLLKVANLGKDPLDVVNIKSVESEFREVGGKERVLRKNKPTPFKGSVPPGEPVTLPYTVSSELREGHATLKVWVDWTTSQGLKERTLAYDSTVTISEPPARWFDPQVLLLYVILLGGGGLGLFAAFRAYTAPSSRSSKRGGRPAASGPSASASVSASSPAAAKEYVSTPAGGKYEEDWIPQGHLPKSKKSAAAAAGSGADSGAETSGAEGGKVRRRKR